MTDHRQQAPAAARNRDPILAVLRGVLPEAGTVLEIASGTGEHSLHFAAALPGLVFQPSDPNPEARSSIAAWAAASGLANLRPPLALDAAAPSWPVTAADAVLCINMIHISPWAATEGLMRGAAAILPPGGPLYLYGPYRRAGVATAPSNEAFDRDLRGRDPAWGLRELETVAALAATEGFSGPAVTEMPANNLSVVFRRL
jgi:SAM-dependent methyltransferase